MGSGHSATHMANASSEPVFVRVDSERFHVTDFEAKGQLGVGGKLSASAEVKKKMVWNKFIEAGFARINPNEFTPYHPKANESRVFVTVWSAMHGYIWNNISELEDDSFIIKEGGNVVKSKYGTIWVERSTGKYLRA